MDSWLWDPPIYEDEDNFSLGGDWQPDFCFWHEPDPIEKDVANEQACIQVLRILITKADTDITELEEDIILLQSQLAWTDETWSELCFVALREKIKFLEMSIKRLKNENLQQQDQQDVDVELQVLAEPAEKIHELLKHLLEKYSPDKDEQHKGSNVENVGISQSKDEVRLINSVAEVCGAKTSGQTTTPLSLEAQKGDDKEKDSQNIQSRDTIIPSQLGDVSGVAFEDPNQRDLDKISAESNTKQGTRNHDLINKAVKNMYAPENEEQAIAVSRNASRLISSYEADSNSRNWGGCDHSEGISTGIQMPSFTNERTILNLLPKEPSLAGPRKLADIIPDAVEQPPNKSIMKPPMPEEEDADRVNKIDPKRMLVTMRKIGTRSPLELKKNDEWPNDRECIIAESLRELSNRRKETRKPEIKAMPMSQILEQMQKTEVTVPKASKSNLLLRHELEQKPCSQPEPQPIQEPCLAVEMELKSSSTNILQNWKSTMLDKHANNTSANRNSRGQTLLDFRRDRSPSAAPDASVTSDSPSEKKRKHSSISPVIKENKESGNIQTTSGRHKDTAHGTIPKDNLMSNCQTKNEAIEDKPTKSLSGGGSMDSEPDLALEFLPMGTLKKLAKVNNLTGYSKLRKEELVKILKAKSRDGDWRE